MWGLVSVYQNLEQRGLIAWGRDVVLRHDLRGLARG